VVKMTSLSEINADCCWGNTCEADFWGLFDTTEEWLQYCKGCDKTATCPSHQERLREVEEVKK